MRNRSAPGKRCFPLAFAGWNAIQIGQREQGFAIVARADNPHMGSQRDQGRSESRGTDKLRRAVVAEDRVIPVVTGQHPRSPIGQQSVASAEIPARRAAAEFAPERALGTPLGAGNILQHLLGSRVTIELRRVEEFVEVHCRADPHAAELIFFDDAESIDFEDVDDADRRDHASLHQAYQVGSTGKDLGLIRIGAEGCDELTFVPRLGVFKVLHGWWP